MLYSKRQNFHRSKLPKLGEMGHIVGLSTVNAKRRCMVIAYPLCDGAIYHRRLLSYGIHTVWVRFLDTSEIVRFSGIWFQSDTP
ncbi:MAG: hypothetical protein J0M33_29020 [Anaerolineae bacterium]|nr:hypothetical protein [Anaerolineae bacterium]